MAALAAQFRLLTFLLTDLAAVLAPFSALGDHAGAGWVRAFLGGGHFTPPERWNRHLTHVRCLRCLSKGTTSRTNYGRGGNEQLQAQREGLRLVLVSKSQMSSAGRIAALYDIHGNLPALEAVLEELGVLRVDLIVVGGDVLPGPL